MISGHRNIRKQKAFTIVELAVVIAVIGILAAISVVGYGAWRERTAANEVQSDLKQAAAAMESARNFSKEGYPNSLPSSFTESANVTVSYKSGDKDSFCIDGVSKSISTVKFFIASDQDGGNPVKGDCNTYLGLVTPIITATALTNTSIRVTITNPSPATTSYNMQRATNSSFTTSLVQTNFTGNETTITGLTKNTMYYFRVQSVAPKGTSDWSNTVSMRTLNQNIWNVASSTTWYPGGECASAACGEYQVYVDNQSGSTMNGGSSTSSPFSVSTGCSSLDLPTCSSVNLTATANQGVLVSFNASTFAASRSTTLSSLNAGTGGGGPNLDVRIPSSVTANTATVQLQYTPTSSNTKMSGVTTTITLTRQ